MKVKCEQCGANVAGWDTVSIGSGDCYRTLCTRCSNQEIAGRQGIEPDDPIFEPVTMTDRSRKRHTFHFRTRLVPTGRSIEAFELIDGAPGGYQFQVLADLEADTIGLFAKLYDRMRRALRIAHIRKKESSTQLRFPGIVRGRVDYDREAPDPHCQPQIVIDGHSFSWDQFGRMLMTFEGWNFRLKLVDPSDEDYLDGPASRLARE